MSRAQVCSIMPRYTVCNRLGFTLQLVQGGLEDEHNAVIELRDGQVVPFHWIDASRIKQCRARIVPTIGTHDTFSTGWSGLIEPEQPGAFSIRFPPDPQGGTPISVLIEIRQRRAATFIIFRQEKDKCLYAIDNRSSKEVEAWQLKPSPEGQETRHKIPMGSRYPLAWDRPMRERTLVVQVAGWRETVQVKMDQFQEVKLPGGLHGEVFADGHARALRIRDSTKAPSSSAASSSAATGRSGGEGDDLDARYSLQVKLAGLGVSVIDAKLDEIMYLGAAPPRACSPRLRAIGILCARA